MFLYRGIPNRNGQRQNASQGTGVWLSDNLKIAENYATSGVIETYFIDDSVLNENSATFNCGGRSGTVVNSTGFFEINTASTVRKLHDSTKMDIIILSNILDLLWIDFKTIPKNLLRDVKMSDTKAVQNILIQAGFLGSTYCIWNPEKYLESISDNYTTVNSSSNIINSSYKNFNYKEVRNYVMQLAQEPYVDDIVNATSSEEILEILNTHLNEINVEVHNIGEVVPDNDNKGVTDYVRMGGLCSDGVIRVEIYADSVASISEDEAYCDDEGDEITAQEVVAIFLKQLAHVIVHEKTHEYQYDKYWDREHSNDAYESMSNYGLDYLTNKDEISAHILGGVIELLDKGYSKEDLLDTFKDGSIEDLMYDTAQLKDYNLTMRVPNMKRFWKELYTTIQNIEE